jgi:hypothetical protein
MIDLAAASLSLHDFKRNTLKNNIIQQNRRSLLVGATLIGLGSGWNPAHHVAPVGAAKIATPSLAITADRIEAQTIHTFAQFSGRISAVDYAEISPQVVGRITEIRFHNGQRASHLVWERRTPDLRSWGNVLIPALTAVAAMAAALAALY